MLKRKTAIILLTVVLTLAIVASAALTMLFADFSKDGIVGDVSPADGSASAAPTAASSFGKLSNGSKYYYSAASASNTTNTVTVVSTATWGTATNPFVISTINQWQLFINYVTAKNTSYNNKVYVLGSDLDFANTSITPVGGSVGTFSGTLYGNKHTIKNVTISLTNGQMGLFYYLSGASIFDLTIDSTVKYNATGNVETAAGTLSALANSVTVVNVVSNANVTVNNSGRTSYAYIAAGGLIGRVGNNSTVNFYKCSYIGTITTVAVSDSITNAGGDNGGVGGFVGRYESGCTHRYYVCYTRNTISQKHGDYHKGGLWGYSYTCPFVIQNTAIDTTQTKAGYSGQSEVAPVGHAWGWIDAMNTSCSVTNLYVKANGLVANDNALFWAYPAYNGSCAVKPNTCTVYSETAYTGVTTTTSTPMTSAASNSTFTSIFTVSGTTTTTKLNSSFYIEYDLAGGSWSPSTAKVTSYTKSTSAQSGKFASLATKPTKSGYTFSKWSFDAAGSTTVTNTSTIPANQTGHLTVYAIWTVNDMTDSLTAQTVTYGASSVALGAGLSHAAGSGVSLSYQWKNTSGSNISGATGSSYTINNPTVAMSGTYSVSITITPQDGRTPAKTVSKSVTLTVKRKGIAVPTGSDKVYNGTTQTGVSNSNSNITLSGETTGVNVKQYKAYANLTTAAAANYCWGSDGGTDVAQKTITWNITKATVAVPTVNTGTFTYNGAAQQPVLNYDTTKVNYTAAPQTNAATYKAQLTLKDATNYKWASITESAQSTTESGTYYLNWTINKANVTLTAPTVAPATGKSHDNRIYVGLTLGDLAIDQNTGTHVRANSSVSVEGTYKFTAATTTKLSSTSNTVNYTFTPTDTTNYNSATVNGTVAAVQLYVKAREVNVKFLDANGQEVDVASLNLGRDGTADGGWKSTVDMAKARTIANIQRVVSDTTVNIPVDYKSTYKLSNLNVANGTSLSGNTISWQRPAGFDLTFYGGVDSSNNGTLEYADGASTAVITADTTVYVGYKAKTNTTYTVINVLQGVTEGDTPTMDELYNMSTAQLKNLENQGYINISTVTGTTAAKASNVAASMPGFARKANMKDGEKTYISYDQGIFILGSGDTILITYYARNTYTVTWSYSGGSIGQVKNKIIDRNVRYNAPIEIDKVPSYDGYEFDGWFYDAAFTQPVTLGRTINMPAYNLTLYASKSAEKYKLEFSYDLDMIEGNEDTIDLKEFQHYMDKLLPKNPEECVDNVYYTVEQISNNGAIWLSSPSIPGFRFMGWEYYDADQRQNMTLSSITKTTAKGPDRLTDEDGEYWGYILTARWEQIEYRVELNANGGVVDGANAISIYNLDSYPAQLTGTSGVPVRAGYKFAYWYYLDKLDDNKEVRVSGGLYDWMRAGTTLYAKWEKEKVTIIYDTTMSAEDIAKGTVKIRSTGATGTSTSGNYGPNDDFTVAETQQYTLLQVGDTLTINVEPQAGYEVETILVGGATFTNGGRYTVKTYSGNKLVLIVVYKEKTFNITYNFEKGSYVGSSQYTTQFTRSSTLNVIGGNLVGRTGYTFNGWRHLVNGEMESLEGVAATENLVEINPYALFGPNNVTLVANWTASPVTMVYHANYYATGSTVETQRRIEPTQGVVTDSTIDLFLPTTETDPDFVPANRELVGWALTANGNIAYNVSYKYIAGDDSEGSLNPSRFKPQPTSYKIQPTANNENHLYAVWRVTNVQTVVFTAEGNNSTFSTESDYTGVTLTGRPRMTYVQEAGLKLTFSWYKVDTANWAMWTQADIDAITNADDKAQAEANLGMYKIPSSAVPAATFTKTGVAGEDQFDTFNVRNVKDAGLYICALEAEGTFNTPTGPKKSTITMYGQFEIIINKADITGVTLDSPENAITYDAAAHKLAVGVPAINAGVWSYDEATGSYRLADGSRLKVTYSYENVDTLAKYADGVTAAGTYRVTASFSFLNDNQNYNAPDPLTAEIQIVRREINNVTYELQTYVSGAWTKVNGATQTYTGNNFRLVATSTDIMEKDKSALTIAMYYDGDLGDGNSYPVNVGSYVVYCDSLTDNLLGDLNGTLASNYVLGSGLTNYTLTINKAKHNIGVTFNDVTASYDGKNHEISINSIRNNNIGINLIINKTADAAVDTFEIDGSTITIRYQVDYAPVIGAFNTTKRTERGGTDAGVYTVTAVFTDSNAGNYEAIDGEEATLTIKQSVYSDGTRLGLSDDQLNRYLKDASGNVIMDDAGHPTQNPEGFGDTHTVAYNAERTLIPHLALDPNLFKVTYTGTHQAKEGESNTSYITTDNKPVETLPGLKQSGLYVITADITYITDEYNNNYVPLSSQVTQLKILNGTIKEIKVSFTQDEVPVYYYGDTIDFTEASSNGYYVQVSVIYDNDGGVEIVDNENVTFLNESGAPFTVFDRASHDKDGNALAGQTVYKVTAGIYGKTGTLDVNVRQAELNYDGIGFAEKEGESRLQSSGNQWTYNFTYDGKYGSPLLAGADETYNFTGVITNDLASSDIVATYKYRTEAGAAWQTMPVGGFKDAGKYFVKVEFENKNSNYQAIDTADGSFSTLNCTVNITPKTLTAADIVWQYATKSDFSDVKALVDGTKVEYRGSDGYYIRATYRNLEQNDPTKSDYYVNIDKIQLGAAAATSTVNVANADDYGVFIVKSSLDGVKNYNLDADLYANLTISPKEVELDWSLTGNVSALTYNGQDQFTTGFSVKYSGVNNEKGDYTTGTVNGVTVSLGNGASAVKDAGTYSVTAAITDSNYTVKSGSETYLITVNPITVDEKTADNPNGNTTISWWYKNTAGDMVEITDGMDDVAYVGKDIEVFVKYSVQNGDSGAGIEDGKRTAPAVTSEGNNPRNADTYRLSAGVVGNYDLTGITLDFTIAKREVEVNWTDPGNVGKVYNGKEQSIKVTAYGVGDESANTIIVVTDNTFKDADDYQAVATIGSDYATNYKLKGANADGEVTYDWSIAQRVISVNWKLTGLVFDNYYALDGWSCDITNVQQDGNGNDDILKLTFRIEDANGDPVNEIINAGHYTIAVVGISDPNYSIGELATQKQPVEVAKADPVVTNVTYDEYTNNIAYMSSNITLRNDKLTYDCDVAGKLTFTDANPVITTSGSRYTYCTFTPDDTDNYNTVSYKELQVLFTEDKIVRVGYDVNSIAKNFTIGESFIPGVVDLFYEYASYYEESVYDDIADTYRTVTFGKREPIGDNDIVTYTYYGVGISVQGKTFSDADVGDNKEIAIRVTPSGQSKAINGTFKFNVIKAYPRSLTVVDKEAIESGTYFIGGKFDITNIKINVDYMNDTSATLSASNFDVTGIELPTTPTQNWVIKFTYFTGTDNEREATVAINVIDKIRVNVNFIDATYRWTDDYIIPDVLTDRNESLPSDIGYTMTDLTGKPLSIKDEGSYGVLVKFTVNESKYYPIPDASATITVRKITASIVEPTKYPTAVRPYTGSAVTDYGIDQITVVDNDNPNTQYRVDGEASYIIKREGYAVDEILRAGVYSITASVKVVSQSDSSIFFNVDTTYTIEIEKVANRISLFTVNSWIYTGEASGKVTIEKDFGTPTYEYYRITKANPNGEALGSNMPTALGNYKVIATIAGSESYEGATSTCLFSITKPELIVDVDTDGNPLTDGSGNNKVIVTSKIDGEGVDPNYNLRVITLKDTSGIEIKKQVVMGGYTINLVDNDGNVVTTTDEYTVKLLLTAEQRDSKNLKVYSVDEYGVYSEINAAVDENGYVSFSTNNFASKFVIAAKDMELAKRNGLIIGISIGAVVVAAAVTALIVVIIKKKKEND